MYTEIDAVFTKIHNEVVRDELLSAVLKDAENNGACVVAASGNTGDGLIHLGMKALLDKLGILLPTVESPAHLPENSIAVMAGGAMIEGVWDDRFRDLRHHFERGGKVIFLACSLYGFKSTLVKYKEQITIFARDLPTYENAINCGVSAHITHDLAFALPLSFYLDYRPLGNQKLNAFSTDAEAVQPSTKFGNLDLSLLWNGLIWSDFEEVERRCKALACVISRYKEISTDRLHLSILSTVLGLKVNLYGTLGGKTAAVFNNSLKEFPNVSFVVDDNPNTVDVVNTAHELLKYSRDLAEMRNNWYEPELDRRAVEITRLEQKINELNLILQQDRDEKARLQHRLISAVSGSKGGYYASIALSNKPAPSSSLMRTLKLIGYVMLPYNARRRSYRRAIAASIWK